MSLLSQFVEEYNKQYSIKEIRYETGLLSEIQKVKDALLDKKFRPSVQLKRTLEKQIRRAKYPIEIAITGQFSSGKSTFLNAILSRNILPTGIVPVTSKVNFINYGEEYKLKVTYYSGADEYLPLESIGEFSDQRKDQMEDVKYLTLYAPMDILKDITFVDTPGLNSQSQRDTEVTRKVLRDVGGIIWLTLIDNAGKMSEAEVLEEYMGSFKNKSLCVLNQKDKLTPNEIERIVEYVSAKFEKYFVQVTPISAKQALESRQEQKDILLEDQLNLISKEFKKDLGKNISVDSLEFFQEKFNNFHKEIEQIQLKDMSNDNKLLQESNINEVLSFIENIMRPQAKEMKEFAIKRDLRNICEILIKEYSTIIGAYDALISVLEEAKEDILEEYESIYKTYSKELIKSFTSIESIMEKISREIFQNIKKQKATRYEKNEGFLKRGNFNKVEYETYWIDSDSVFQNLFYDDQLIERMFKRAMKELKEVELLSDEAYKNVYRNIKLRVYRWQELYELIKKNREIASNAEFSATRHFAAKVYENILKEYHRAILENIAALRKKFAYFNGALSYSYMQVTQATISHFDQQINESVSLYNQDPTRFQIYYPREDEILTKLKANFGFEKIEDFLTSKRNYLFKIVQYSKKQYLEITDESIEFVESKKGKFLFKIEELKKIQASI